MSPFRSGAQHGQSPLPVAATQFQEQPTVLPEISQASDFRTSLIVRDLSKRFSVLRSPTGDPLSVQALKHKFAEQRRRGAENQITEEEEVMLLETLGRMRSRNSARSTKSQDTINEYAEQPSTNATNSTIHASPASSPRGKPTKRYSNNLFGSGRLRDYTYFRNVGTNHGRAGSPHVPSMTPTETTISIQEVSSLTDSLQHLIPDNSSIESSTGNKPATSLVIAAGSDEQAVEPPITSSVLGRVSVALADAIKELEGETDDEVVMPRLSRPSTDLGSRQPEGIVELARASQSSLHSPTVVEVEAGTAISSDKQVTIPSSDHRASPLQSRILPGYVPGMPRPMTPRDLDMDEQRSHSTTPRAMSPLPADMADSATMSMSQQLSSIPPRPGSTSSISGQSPWPPSPAAAFRPSTPSRSTPLFLQRSPGRRTPDDDPSASDTIEFDNPFNSSVMSKRRPPSSSAGSAYQPSVSSRPSTPSNIVWNVGQTESNYRKNGHVRNGSWLSDAGMSDGQGSDMHSFKSRQTLPQPVTDSSLVDVFGTDFGSSVSTSSRVARSPTPTHNSPRSPAFPSIEISPRNGSKRSSRQNTSSPFLFGQYPPLVFLPVVNSSRSSLESLGSSYHSWEGDKDKCLSIFSDADTQQPAWHDIHLERVNSIISNESVDDDEWDPEEVIGRYAGLKKSDFKAMQEKLVSLSMARGDARERVPSIRRRRPSTSQSNYSVNGRDRILSPPPASPTASSSEQNPKATAVLSAMADSIQSRQLGVIDTSVQRAPDTEPSPNTRRHRDLAQALFGDDMEKEREQTPKPPPVSCDTNVESEEAFGNTEIESESGPETLAPSASSLSNDSAVVSQGTDLAKEVQEKAEAATLALGKNQPKNEQHLERSILGSISRRRINPSHISEPRLVSSSASVDTIPVRPPPNNNTGSSKIGSRFLKLRGSLRAKNPTPVRDEQPGTKSPVPSQIMTGDTSKVTLPPNATSVAECGRTKVVASSNPAPGLKGFMARFRSKKAADNATLNRRGTSPSVVSLAASQADRTAQPQSVANDSVVPSSSSSLHHVPEHVYSSQEAAAMSDPEPNEAALQQLFAAASNLGLDRNALNALIARSSTSWKPQERSITETNGSAAPKASEGTIEASKGDQPTVLVTPADEPITPQTLPTQENGNATDIVGRKSESRTSEDCMPENIANVIVRRTIIYSSDPHGSPIPFDPTSLSKKGSHRRRASMASNSSRSVQDRVPTPPPPKSSTSKSFAVNGSSPPVPQIPQSLLANTDSLRTSSYMPRHSFEKSNSAYDSLYEMYSEDINGNELPASAQKAHTHANPDVPALELVELANGETIWSIVNSLREGDNESASACRMSFTSEFSGPEGSSEGLQAYVKEHKKTGSKGSNLSFASRRRLSHGMNRPETKVYYSTSAQIGRLIESLSQGTESGAFKISSDSHRPAHSPSSSLSMPPSSNEGHWTIEERLEHLLESIANR